MATTQEDIRRWLESAKKQKAQYMLVICDSFDYEDYPVDCMTAKECWERYNNPGSMQRVMECYDLSMDIEKQLGAGRALNLPK